MIGGELSVLLREIKFNSKQELLCELKLLKKEVYLYKKEDRNKILPHLEIAIEQAYYTKEKVLLRHKNLLTRGNNKWKKKK